MKNLTKDDLYQEEFLKGLDEAQKEVEAGEFEEVKTFEDFVSKGFPKYKLPQTACFGNGTQ